MDLDRTHGLAFLLSLAALPLAGCPAASEDTTTSGTGDTTGDSQTGDPTTDPSTVSITSADTTDASNSMSTTVDPTTDPSTDPTTVTDSTTSDATTDPTDATTSAEDTTTDPSTGEGTTGSADPLCVNFVDHVIECVPKYGAYQDYLLAYCDEALASYGAYSPECGAAAEEMFACLTTADCKDLIAGEPCTEEQQAVASLCGGGESTGSGGDSP